MASASIPIDLLKAKLAQTDQWFRWLKWTYLILTSLGLAISLRLYFTRPAPLEFPAVTTWEGCEQLAANMRQHLDSRPDLKAFEAGDAHFEFMTTTAIRWRDKVEPPEFAKNLVNSYQSVFERHSVKLLFVAKLFGAGLIALAALRRKDLFLSIVLVVVTLFSTEAGSGLLTPTNFHKVVFWFIPLGLLALGMFGLQVRRTILLDRIRQRGEDWASIWVGLLLVVVGLVLTVGAAVARVRAMNPAFLPVIVGAVMLYRGIKKTCAARRRWASSQ